MKVRAILYERFSHSSVKEGFPSKPVVVSKSVEMERKEAISYVNEYIEKMLYDGWRLKRGPEGKMSLYKEDSTSITDYHTWYVLEKIEEEN